MQESLLERWSTTFLTALVAAYVGSILATERGAPALLVPVSGFVLVAIALAYGLALRAAVQRRAAEWDRIAAEAGLARTEEPGRMRKLVRFGTYARQEGDLTLFAEPTGAGDGAATLVATAPWGEVAGEVRVRDGATLRARVDAYARAAREGTEPPEDEEAAESTLHDIVVGVALLAFVGMHALRLGGMRGWFDRWDLDAFLLTYVVLLGYLVLTAAVTLLEGRQHGRHH